MKLILLLILSITCGTIIAQVGLHVAQGRSNSAGHDGGYAWIGNPDGTHLSLDNNEIQARSGNNPTTLYLNFFGGNVNLVNNADNPNGRVGIGTTTPEQKLDIIGNTYISDQLGIGTSSLADDVSLHIKSDNEAIRLDGTAPFLSFYDGSDYRGYLWMTSLDDMYLFNRKNRNLYFGTDNSTKMTIMGDGNVGIGTPTPSAKLEIRHNSNQSDPHIVLTETEDDDFARIKFFNSGSDYWNIAGATGTTDRFNLFFYDGSNGNNFFSIDPVNDNIVIDGDVIPGSTAYDLGNNNATEHWDDCVADDFINFSDKRLKKNINELDNMLPALMKLRPVTYEYKATHNPDGRTRTGFVAQEVQKILPSVVVDEDVDTDWRTKKTSKTKVEYLSLNYIEMIPMAIKAIQEQQAIIDQKQAQIDEKQAQIDALNQRMERLELLVTRLTTSKE